MEDLGVNGCSQKWPQAQLKKYSKLPQSIKTKWMSLKRHVWARQATNLTQFHQFKREDWAKFLLACLKLQDIWAKLTFPKLFSVIIMQMYWENLDLKLFKCPHLSFKNCRKLSICLSYVLNSSLPLCNSFCVCTMVIQWKPTDGVWSLGVSYTNHKARPIACALLCYSFRKWSHLRETPQSLGLVVLLWC